MTRVCLKMGYIPNYSHLVGIMIINHWVQWGTLFSDKPTSRSNCFFFYPCWASSATQVEFRLVLSTFSTHNSWIWKAEKVESSKRKLSTCSNCFWLVVWTYPSEKWWTTRQIGSSSQLGKKTSRHVPVTTKQFSMLDHPSEKGMMDPRMDIAKVTASRLSRLSRYFLRVHQGIKKWWTLISTMAKIARIPVIHLSSRHESGC